MYKYVSLSSAIQMSLQNRSGKLLLITFLFKILLCNLPAIFEIIFLMMNLKKKIFGPNNKILIKIKKGLTLITATKRISAHAQYFFPLLPAFLLVHWKTARMHLVVLFHNF